MNKTIKNSLLLLLLSTSITKTSDFENGIKVVGAFALAGAAIFGLVKVVDWATTESNDSLNQRAIQRLQSAQSKFTRAIQVANHTNNMQTESRLYSLYQEARTHDSNTLNYIGSLNNTIKLLNNLASKLKKRIQKLSSKQDNYENKNAYNQLTIVLNDINSCLYQLNQLACILNNDRSYFKLSDSYSTYTSKYGNEISCLTDSNIIHQALMKFRQQRYPLIEYQREITQDLNHLQEEIQSTTYNYVSLINNARKLYDSIFRAYSLITASHTLNAEIIRREQDKREEEKLEIEKRKAKAAEHKAKALKEQARAQREEAEAKKREAAVRERELRERELRERQYYGSQPSHTTNIYL